MTASTAIGALVHPDYFVIRAHSFPDLYAVQSIQSVLSWLLAEVLVTTEYFLSFGIVSE